MFLDDRNKAGDEKRARWGRGGGKKKRRTQLPLGAAAARFSPLPFFVRCTTQRAGGIRAHHCFSRDGKMTVSGTQQRRRALSHGYWTMGQQGKEVMLL